MMLRRLSSVRNAGLYSSGAAVATLFALTHSALAEGAGEGHAVPGQMGFQHAVSPVAADIHWFHDKLLLPIISIICLFVLALLVWVVIKFNEKANPTPSRTTHNSILEVAWTILPVLILVVIAIPSFRLLDRAIGPAQSRPHGESDGQAMVLDV